MGSKPYVCTECSEKFTQSSNLQKHMRKHANLGGQNLQSNNNSNQHHNQQQQSHQLQQQPYNGNSSGSNSNGNVNGASNIENGNVQNCYPNSSLVGNSSANNHHPLTQAAMTAAANAFFSNHHNHHHQSTKQLINTAFEHSLDAKFISGTNFLHYHNINLPKLLLAHNHFLSPGLTLPPPFNGSSQHHSSASALNLLNNSTNPNSPQSSSRPYSSSNNTRGSSPTENGNDLGNAANGSPDNPNRFLSMKLSIANGDD